MNPTDLCLQHVYRWPRILEVVFGPGDDWADEAARALASSGRPLSAARLEQLKVDPSDDQLYSVLDYASQRLEGYRARRAEEPLPEDEGVHFSDLLNIVRILGQKLADYALRFPEAGSCEAAQRYAANVRRRLSAADQGFKWGERLHRQQGQAQDRAARR